MPEYLSLLVYFMEKPSQESEQFVILFDMDGWRFCHSLHLRKVHAHISTLQARLLAPAHATTHRLRSPPPAWLGAQGCLRAECGADACPSEAAAALWHLPSGACPKSLIPLPCAPRSTTQSG